GVILVQSLAGLGLMIGGADMFVHLVKDVALHMGVSPLILALLIAPIATELPEAMNSFFWVYKKKDALAVGNITGAMVFQGTFPVAIGLLGTPWVLGAGSLLSILLTLVAATLFLLQIQVYGKWQPRALVLPL